MTLPGADAPAPGLGLVSPEPSMMDHDQMQHATSAVDTATPKSDHTMTELPSGRAAAIIVGTFAILLVAVWLTNFVVPVRF
jgi:hypothetical protein